MNDFLLPYSLDLGILKIVLLLRVTWAPFARDRIEIGSKTIWIVLNPIRCYHSVYTGSEPKLCAFTRDQIHLDPF